MQISRHSACRVSIPKRVSEALKQFADLEAIAIKLVSIPKRVSEALKPLNRNNINALPNVSIPKRVSEALKRSFSPTGESASLCFNP